MKRGEFRFELQRKLIHLLFGIALILVVQYPGRAVLTGFLTSFLFFGGILIALMMRGLKVPAAGWLLERFEREDVRFPGYGAFWFVVGALLISVSLTDAEQISAAIAVLSCGDSVATIIGVLGRHPLPHNRRKTFEGSAAFFVFSLSACLFVGLTGVALAAIGAIIEGLDTPVDDNLLVPIASIIFFKIIG